MNRSVSQYDYPNLETLAKNIIKEKQPFERLLVKKKDLLEMFKVCNCSLTISHFISIIRTKSISSMIKFLIIPRPLSIAAVLWLIFVVVHMFLIQVASRRLQSPRSATNAVDDLFFIHLEFFLLLAWQC